MFRTYLCVEFPPQVNPADVMLDEIQNKHPAENLAALSRCGSCVPTKPPVPDPSVSFFRVRVAFITAVTIQFHRAVLQTLESSTNIAVSQVLVIFMLIILTRLLPITSFTDFMIQSCSATLLLMLLQGIAALKVFGSDILVIMREARAGVSCMALFIAKDCAAFFEITISSCVFALVYSWFSGISAKCMGCIPRRMGLHLLGLWFELHF